MTKNTKYVHLEIMRIFAAFFVIFNHVGVELGDGYLLFASKPIGSLQMWCYLVVSVFCRFNVPLFLAISGALMLGRPCESFQKNLVRILKTAMILLIWSIAYYAYDIYKTQENFILKDFLVKLYSTQTKYHLWYLYLHLALLITLPFLKGMVQNLDDKLFYYMFGIAVFFDGILPSIEYLVNKGTITLNGNLKISWLVNQGFLYPCLGYFMQNRLDIQKYKKYLPLLWIFNVLGISASCYMTYYKGMYTALLRETTFHSSFRVINCVVVFITIRCLFEKANLPNILNKIIISVGKCTFGIYLLHPFILEQRFFQTCSQYLLQRTGINDMAVYFMLCFITMAICYIIILLLSKIPILKKLVGF